MSGDRDDRGDGDKDSDDHKGDNDNGGGKHHHGGDDNGSGGGGGGVSGSPEPASMILVGTGLIGLALSRKRRNGPKN
jgi:hypothetical protein